MPRPRRRAAVAASPSETAAPTFPQTTLDIAEDVPPPDGTFMMVPTALIATPADIVAPSGAFLESVRVNGVMVPILLIAPDPDRNEASYRIVDGRRRFIAAWREGLEDVPSMVLPCTTTERQAQAATVVTNTLRSANPVSEFIAIHGLVLRGQTPEDVARTLNIPVTTVRSRLRYASLVPPLLSAFTEGRLHPSVAYAAARLSQARQTDLVDLLNTRGAVTHRDVRSVREAAVRDAAAALPNSLFPDLTPQGGSNHARITVTPELIPGELRLSPTGDGRWQVRRRDMNGTPEYSSLNMSPLVIMPDGWRWFAGARHPQQPGLLLTGATPPEVSLNFAAILGRPPAGQPVRQPRVATQTADDRRVEWTRLARELRDRFAAPDAASASLDAVREHLRGALLAFPANPTDESDRLFTLIADALIQVTDSPGTETVNA